jgi:hypothetical protein
MKVVGNNIICRHAFQLCRRGSCFGHFTSWWRRRRRGCKFGGIQALDECIPIEVLEAN